MIESLKDFGEETELQKACQYALLSEGKRLRPLVVFLVADAIGKGLDVTKAALSVEFFHTASLIVDDLPCMDNDDFRRNKPSLHKIFGEDIAILASYSIMIEGFKKIRESASGGELCSIALKEATLAAGIHGVTGGQYLDLYPKGTSFSEIKEVLEKKTARLFEIATLFGWLFGGGELSFLEDVKKLGYHFGMAFQIADDIKDLAQDKKKQNPVNLAGVLGLEKALDVFAEECNRFLQVVEKLNLKKDNFLLLQNKLQEYVKDALGEASLQH